MKRTNMFPKGGSGQSSPGKQRGVALVIALVLLIVVTLLGLASIRGTGLQEKMAANTYDREVAFQAAEAALRVAEARLGSTTQDIWRDCEVEDCETSPIDAPDSAWVTVDEDSAGFDKRAESVGSPQYVVDDLGLVPDAASNTGFDQSGAASQYGAQGTSLNIHHYRVTARSADPDDVGDRAIVILQSWVRG